MFFVVPKGGGRSDDLFALDIREMNEAGSKGKAVNEMVHELGTG